MSNIRLICILSLLVSNQWLRAQDAAFSLYESSMLYLNPAYAGEERNLEIAMNYRTQWKSVSVPYQTYQTSVMIPFYKGVDKTSHLGGLGVSIHHDVAGTGELKTTGANFSLAKSISISELNNLSFGFQAGVIQRKIDYSNLQWGEQYQPFFGFNSNIVPTVFSNDLENRKYMLDMAAGLVYYYNDIQEYTNKEFSAHVGVSAYHLNSPNESFSPKVRASLPRILKLNAGMDVPLSDYFYLSPMLLTLYQGNTLQINSGLKLIYNLHNQSSNKIFDGLIVSAGSSYRLNDGFIFSAGMGNQVFLLQYAFDLNKTKLGNQINNVNANELSLILRNPVEHLFRKVESPRY